MDFVAVTPFQTFGDKHMADSWKAWKEDKINASWGHSFIAHFGYLADLVVSVVIIPFALIGTMFGLLHAAYMWSEKKSELYQNSVRLLHSKTHRLFTSLLGVFTPAGAYSYRNRSILPEAGVVLAISLVGYFFMSNSPNKLGLDSKGNWKFGWNLG